MSVPCPCTGQSDGGSVVNSNRLETSWLLHMHINTYMNKLNKVTGPAHVIITGLSPPAEPTMAQLYGEREPPTTDIRWLGEGTLAVFGGKTKGGTRNRGREGGGREGRRQEGRKENGGVKGDRVSSEE